MAEGTYEYECMRAELLGVDKPDYDEFMKKKTEREAAERAAIELATKKEYDAQRKSFQNTSTKLDELGNILKSTQRKITNLTTPFSSYLKSKIGMAGSSKEDVSSPAADRAEIESDRAETDSDRAEIESDQEEYKEPFGKVNNYPEYPLTMETKDMNTALDNMPLIDDLIEKNERLALGMQYQIKQMKRFNP